jgi:hypothetical protein
VDFVLSQLEVGTLLLLVAVDLPPLPDPIWTEHLMWAWGAKPVHSIHEAKAALVRVGGPEHVETR